jgi:F-type H+-transporting ATPase subunit epsilon
MMSTLRPGVVTVAQGDGAPLRLFVRGGFADVAPGGFTLLAEQAIPLSEMKPEELARSIKDAQDDLNDARSDEARSLAAERLAQLQDLQRAILN